MGLVWPWLGQRVPGENCSSYQRDACQLGEALECLVEGIEFFVTNKGLEERWGQTDVFIFSREVT